MKTFKWAYFRTEGKLVYNDVKTVDIINYALPARVLMVCKNCTNVKGFIVADFATGIKLGQFKTKKSALLYASDIEIALKCARALEFSAKQGKTFQEVNIPLPSLTATGKTDTSQGNGIARQ